mmetsp:Transcript_2204/g.6720  ORF Transcript_2204/g.6720 Transcript_2204/m.6720 type:complete len:81 (+) Transcript_2204:765-1007(+)
MKRRLELARLAGDSLAAEKALGDLAAARPRLTARKAEVLKLGKCLAEVETAPPGGSAVASKLAKSLLADIRALAPASGCN